MSANEEPARAGDRLGDLLANRNVTNTTVVTGERHTSTFKFNPFDETLSRAARWTLPASRLDVSERAFDAAKT
jgi:hypothetical protein